MKTIYKIVVAVTCVVISCAVFSSDKKSTLPEKPAKQVTPPEFIDHSDLIKAKLKKSIKASSKKRKPVSE